MSEDAKKLLAIIAYAGSDAGQKMLTEYLDDVARLRGVERAAREVVEEAPLLPPHHLVACVDPKKIEALRAALSVSKPEGK